MYNIYIYEYDKFIFIKKILVEFLKYSVIVKYKSFKEYNLIYSDYSNIIQLFALKLFKNKKIVLRLLGMNSVQNTQKFFFLKKMFYKIINYLNYDFIVCSQDGSGDIKDLKYYFPNCKNIRLLFNGVSKTNFSKKISKSTIGFIGRFEKIKGIGLFLKINRKLSKYFDFKLIGDSENFDRKYLENLKKTFFLGKVQNQKINNLHRKINLVISINEAGNFSNVNLECINNYTPFLFCSFDKKKDIFIKKELKKFNLDLSIDNSYTEIGLTGKINYYFKNKKKIDSLFKKFCNYFKKKYLISWPRRIDREISLLKKIL